LLACDVHIDHDVGTVEAHTRAASVVAVVAEPVGDAVFNLVCDKLGVAEFVGKCHRID
jgi:hypothetical protein